MSQQSPSSSSETLDSPVYDEQIAQARERILGDIALALIFIGFPAMIATLSGGQLAGHPLVYIVQAALFGGVVILALLRRLPLTLRATLLIGALFVAGSLGLANSGPLGSGRLMLLVAVVLATLMFGVRQGAILIGLLVVVRWVIMVAALEEWIVYEPHPDYFLHEPVSLISALAIDVLLAAMLVAGVGGLYMVLMQNIHSLTERSVSLARENAERLRMEDELETAFARVRETEQYRTRFIENVSHELRTPVANLKLYHHLLAQRPEKQEAYLATMARELERLQTIVEEMNYFAHIRHDVQVLSVSQVDLNRLVMRTIANNIDRARRQNQVLTGYTHPQEVFVQGEISLLERVLNIMLDNSLKYTPPDGRIHVQICTRHYEGRAWAGFSVSNDGPALSSDERKQLFAQFFRGHAARERGTAGAGLGLAIAREIVELHHGRIEVDSPCDPPPNVPDELPTSRGVTFTVWLPRVVSAAKLDSA